MESITFLPISLAHWLHTDIMISADSRLAPSQWETSLQSNDVSHWLGANLQNHPWRWWHGNAFGVNESTEWTSQRRFPHHEGQVKRSFDPLHELMFTSSQFNCQLKYLTEMEMSSCCCRAVTVVMVWVVLYGLSMSKTQPDLNIISQLTHWPLGDFKEIFRKVIFMLILVIDGWSISCKIVLKWMPMDFDDAKSTLVQVMAWCRQATSHYLSQCWPRSLSTYGVNRPQWVNRFSIDSPDHFVCLVHHAHWM